MQQVGRVLLIQSILINVSVLIETYGSQTFYIATLDWLPGFIFLVGGIAIGVCGVIVMVAHFMLIKPMIKA